MTRANGPNLWRSISSSVRGASHVRANKPNQDHFAVERCDSDGWIAAAVADGHGNRKCFRSDRGSRFAALSAVELLAQCAKGDGVQAFRQDFSVDLTQRIVRSWEQRVEADLLTEPIGLAELEGLSDLERQIVERDPRTAYGSTLVAALLLGDLGVYLQLGDGDILIVDDQAENASRPLPSDSRSFANETASLASPIAGPSNKRPSGDNGAWADFRVRVVPATARPPALVLLTTDGYPNAFVDDAAFRKAATDILAIGHIDGLTLLNEQLPSWLDEASRNGSGDDVTVVLLVREPLYAASVSPEESKAGLAPPEDCLRGVAGVDLQPPPETS